MNINLWDYIESPPATGVVGDSIAEDIREHHEILGRSGRWTLTGEVALVPPSEPGLVAAGVLQVWSKTAEGMWLHITSDGMAVEAACPIGD